jgi:acetyltransferase-like isoleucine patch superfamily enzyme
MLHPSYMSALVRRRKFCILAPTSRLARQGRIYNLTGDQSTISVGGNSLVQGELMTFPRADMLSIGEWSYVGVGTRIWCRSTILIGDRVFIAHNVDIFDSLTHPLDPKERHAQFVAMSTTGHPDWVELDPRPVVLQDDCWIGAGSAVMRGVTIGAGAIVATRSVVTKDVPAGALVGGNPAQILRLATENK